MKETKEKSYPSWKNTRPVRLSIDMISFLKSKAKYGEALGEVAERLLRRQMAPKK